MLFLYTLLLVSDLVVVVEFLLLLSLVRRLPRRGKLWIWYYRLRWYDWPRSSLAQTPICAGQQSWMEEHEPLIRSALAVDVAAFCERERWQVWQEEACA
jgi:hypothetical protein